jgi:hypothetical protein
MKVMPLMLFAALMMAQAPAAAQPAQPAQTAAKKAKPKQHCVFTEVTGSRTRQRVCQNENGQFDLGPDVAGAGPNSGMFHAPPPTAQPTSMGAPPR